MWCKALAKPWIRSPSQHQAMAGHERRDDGARRAVRDVLTRTGHEIRNARLDHDLSQQAAGRAIGVSISTWSRIERGAATNLSLDHLVRAAAVVGLEMSVRAYPGGRPLRDAAHLALLERLRSRLGAGIRWQTEVPLPNPGDKRAWDALARSARVRIGIEAETRARDSQQLQRRLALKRRDGAVDHVILLLADTRHNRGFARTAGVGFQADFPIPANVALKCLARGDDPGGSAIILL
jgi:transcriptional regulator with XRE-family HTH domain